MNNLRAQKDEEARKNEEKARKVHGEYDTLLEKVQKLRDKNTLSHQWNVSELKLMVKWFKRDGDAPIPLKKNELFARYEATMNHKDCLPPPPAQQLPPPPDDASFISGTYLDDNKDDSSHFSGVQFR